MKENWSPSCQCLLMFFVYSQDLHLSDNTETKGLQAIYTFNVQDKELLLGWHLKLVGRREFFPQNVECIALI
ncbi:hypothetical protein BCR33DRAFT_720524, partial [Rhizoclosmatium globosum]